MWEKQFNKNSPYEQHAAIYFRVSPQIEVFEETLLHRAEKFKEFQDFNKARHQYVCTLYALYTNKNAYTRKLKEYM